MRRINLFYFSFSFFSVFSFFSNFPLFSSSAPPAAPPRQQLGAQPRSAPAFPRPSTPQTLKPRDLRRLLKALSFRILNSQHQHPQQQQQQQQQQQRRQQLIAEGGRVKDSVEAVVFAPEACVKSRNAATAASASSSSSSSC
ncbi:hypothetical protein Emed_004976 [Eimeria media]